MPRTHRGAALVVLIAVVAIPAARAVAGIPEPSEITEGVQVEHAGLISQGEADEAARRCRGMDLVLRDRNGGAAIPIGPADGPGRVVPVPAGEPGRFALECQDGYLLGLDTPPLSGGGELSAAEIAGRLAEIETEHAAAIKALRNVAPDLEVAGRFATLFNGLHIRVSVESATRLRRAGYRLWDNGEVRATLNDSVPLINADDVWVRNNGKRPATDPLPGSTGRGVKIAILDTGIDYEHPDLGGCFGHPLGATKTSQCKVAGGYDVVNGDGNPMDDNGHGTHVAAIAAGNGVLRGVAPEAQLYAYKVLDKYGSGNPDDVLEGLERAVDPNRDGYVSDAADVINLSLGVYGTPGDPLSTAVDNAVEVGSVVVAAAGNVTPGFSADDTITSPGTSRRAITVGASTKGDAMSTFSSRGPVVWDGQAILKPDLVAPGENICAAGRASSSAQTCLDQQHVSLSGTSMAAPHVAGTAALLLEEYPTLTPERVRSILKSSAATLKSDQSVVARGAGRVDALAAINMGSDAPVAILDPIPQEGSVLPISGTVRATGLTEWRLSYARYAAADLDQRWWYDLARSTQPPSGSVLHQLAVRAREEGAYTIRLTVRDYKGRQAVDYGYVEIDKVGFSRPLANDVLRGGDVVPVELDVDPSMSGTEIRVEYGPGEPPSTLTTLKPVDGTRYSWDTAGLPGGRYTLQLTARHDGLDEKETVAVTLDPRLAPGWPVRVPLDTECPTSPGPCPIYTGWADPVAEDLNGDGTREILFLRYSSIPELRAYGASGALLWTTAVGSTQGSGTRFDALGYLHQPAVADLDADGRKEVLVFNTIDSSVYVFAATGAVREVWSVPVGADELHTPRVALADVNADGRDELVLSVNAFTVGMGDRPKIVVLSTVTGAKLAEWFVTNAPRTSNSFIGTDYNYAPAVGDLDGDPQLEIVAAEDISGQIHAFEWNGEKILGAGTGWPIKGAGQEYFPVAIGDLEGDGDNEVVAGMFGGAALSRVWAVDGDGTVLPGWPMDFDSTITGTSLGDLDRDGDLEIVLPMSGQTLALDHKGRQVPGWPVAMTQGAAAYPGAVGDLDGDGGPDVVVHAAKKAPGSVEVWSVDGTPLFSMPVEQSEKAPVLVTEVGGSVAVIAASDSDLYWASSTQAVSKQRLSIYLWKLDAPYVADAMPWPMFQQNPGHTGVAAMVT